MTRLFRLPRAALAGLACTLAWTSAAMSAPLTYRFDASLADGPLQGTQFAGEFSFDPTTASGVGKEVVSMTALDFTLMEVPFTRADIQQGGQVILQDGRVVDFTAGFASPNPEGSPVASLTFGLRAVGEITYGQLKETGMVTGLGSYAIAASPLPELPAGWLLAAGMGVLVFVSCRFTGPPRMSRRIRSAAPSGGD